MPFHFFHPSGGVVYHWRALRYRKTPWAEFRNGVTEWITEWVDGLREFKGNQKLPLLVVVGGSAGHCFPFGVLASFERLAVIDPDPIGRLWFQYRAQKAAPGLEIEWVADYWPQSRTPKGWTSVTPLIFSNFLGQIEFTPHHQRGLQDWIAGRPFLSFHDRLSGDLEPTIPLQWAGPEKLRGQLSSAELLERFYCNKTGELTPHLDFSFEKIQPVEYRYFSWPIRPGYWNLIEGVRSNHGH